MTTNRLPPGPKGMPLIGCLLEFYRDPLGFFIRNSQEYGDIVYFRIGPWKFFLLNHPDYIQEVLVSQSGNFLKTRPIKRAKAFLGEGLLTTDGDFHRRQRRLSQPAFHRKRIEEYAGVMSSYAAATRDRWSDGSILDISKEMVQLSMTIVAKTLFDTNIESEAREIGELIKMAMERWLMLVLPLSELFEKLPLSSIRRFYRARDRVDATIYRMIRERRRSSIDRGDLLSMLLLARDEEDQGAGMSDEQVRDEAMTIFLAGHETMTNALTWTWYLLSQNQEAEAKLHSEIDEVLEGRLPTVENVNELQYTRMVFAEALRLYPPIWAMSRQAINDFELDSYTIPGGSNVFMSQYLVHHDPRFFPDPYLFIPERWSPNARADYPRFSYFPFGAGPRQCIGESFAWMEGVLVIATIAQKWKMRLIPGHPVELQPLISLRPKYGMTMRLERR